MEETTEERQTHSWMARSWLRDGALIALAFAIGWWAHSAPMVRAQGGDLSFQLPNLSNGTALALYYPDQQTIYVYQSAMAGFSTLNCAYEFRLSKPGGAIERRQCKVPGFRP
jgi:hypothetical protein